MTPAGAHRDRQDAARQARVRLRRDERERDAARVAALRPLSDAITDDIAELVQSGIEIHTLRPGRHTDVVVVTFDSERADAEDVLRRRYGSDRIEPVREHDHRRPRLTR